jgi:predicted nucleic acid-binding protein
VIGLLDTSVLVAREAGRAIARDLLPDEAVISVVTFAELHAGVLAASNTASRAARLATLEAVAAIEQIPIDSDAAVAWAEMRARLAEAGRRVNVNDLWIAATAVAHGLTVYTQDEDFDLLPEYGGPTVVLV